MTAELATIRVAFEDEGMSPEDIASDRGLDIAAVKGALMQTSSKFRKLCGKEPEEEDELNFSKEQQIRFKEGLVDLALGAEDEHLRFKALTYCRDDAKGRKDVVKGMAGNNFNVLMINQKMQQIRAVTNGIKERVINAT